jgi:hypothetical protein
MFGQTRAKASAQLPSHKDKALNSDFRASRDDTQKQLATASSTVPSSLNACPGSWFLMKKSGHESAALLTIIFTGWPNGHCFLASDPC